MQACLNNNTLTKEVAILPSLFGWIVKTKGLLLLQNKTIPAPFSHPPSAAVCQHGEKERFKCQKQNDKDVLFWCAALGWILWTCTRWTWGWRRRGWPRCRHRPACWLHNQRRPRWLCQMARPHPSWGGKTIQLCHTSEEIHQQLSYRWLETWRNLLGAMCRMASSEGEKVFRKSKVVYGVLI